MKVDQILKLRDDPALFASVICKSRPFTYNIPFLRSKDKYRILRHGRQSGKSQNICAAVGHFAVFADWLSVLPEGETECDVIYTAQKFDIAALMCDKIIRLLRNHPWTESLIIKDVGKLKQIRFATGRGVCNIRPTALGETGAGARGNTVSGIIEDENAYQNEDAITALEGTGAARDPFIWVASTPDGEDTPFYRRCKNARMGNEPIDDVYSDDVNAEWVQFCAKSKQSPMITDRYLNMQKEKLTHEMYMQEYEAQFIGLGDYMYNRQSLNHAAINNIDMDVNNTVYDIGVDVARLGKDQTVYTVIQSDGESAKLVYYDSEDLSVIPMISSKIFGLYTRFKARNVYLESNGIGGGVIDDLSINHGLQIPDTGYTPKTKAETHNNLLRLLTSHRVDLTICNDHRHILLEQLRSIKKEFKNNVMHLVAKHDDWADSLALACNGLKKGRTIQVFDSAPAFT
ncbi:MAG: hypothetical protein F4X97_02010 [Boseongicola sp. SB0662_bin_57]|nr:hypothetical protein [Boseongicola sp. SB0662_bin_57]